MATFGEDNFGLGEKSQGSILAESAKVGVSNLRTDEAKRAPGGDAALTCVPCSVELTFSQQVVRLGVIFSFGP